MEGEQMNDQRDPAEYDEASYSPDMTASDDPQDIIRDAVESSWAGKLPATKAESLDQAKRAAMAILRALHDAGKMDALSPATATADHSLVLPGVLGSIITAKDPALSAHCAAVAVGRISSLSETQIADMFGVTRATVSYICCRFRDEHLSGKPSPAMKSMDAVAKYSQGRKGKCAKQAAPPWQHMQRFKEAFKPTI
jgi:hypothetical protein